MNTGANNLPADGGMRNRSAPLVVLTLDDG
jgi:hypothetical protein